VVITFYLADGATIERRLTVGPTSRATVAVHDPVEGVGRGHEAAARVVTTNPGGIVVERPMYFRYIPTAGGDSVTGGHIALGATSPRADWYFAEGYTGAGFDEYLAILNPHDRPAPVTITYFLADGRTATRELTVRPRARATVRVHDPVEGVGRGQEVSVHVGASLADGIVVERPTYFAYTLSDGAGGGRVTGGHTALGAAAPGRTWHFAEGYTGAGFDQYLTLLNPADQPAPVTITYYREHGGPLVRSLVVAGRSRATVAVHDERLGVGRGVAAAALVTTTSPTGIVAERPMYFRYAPAEGQPGAGVDGGHDAMGAPAARGSWHFAEGYTGPGFDEYLTILNPADAPADVRLAYYLPNGATVERTLVVPAAARATVAVHDRATGVGRDASAGVRVTTASPGGIVVERPMYFTYNGWTGGHTTAGYAP
jgi:hypothetical protein